MAINWIETLKMINKALPEIQDVIIGVTIIALVVGILLDVALDSTIPVVGDIATWLNGTWVGDVVTALGSLSTGFKIVLTLLVVVIVIYLFQSKGKSGQGSNM